MATRRRAFLAIVDPSGLQHIVDRQPVGDALRAYLKRSRRDHLDLAMPEPCAAAAVFDRGHAAAGLEQLRGTGLRAMLEAGKRGNVGDALASWRIHSGHATDLPQPR